MPEEVRVNADPTPDPTPEEQDRLRRQLEANLNSFQKAGLTAEAEAVEKRLSELGYEVVDEPETFAPTADVEVVDLEGMTKDELIGLADERGVQVTSSMNKADIVAALEEG